MRNLLITICYDGTDYHGWQVQPNGMTVQQAVQDAIEKIFSKRENITGCSRTDAGVHANNFCFNMKTESEMNCYRLIGALNAVLPDDIAVKSCVEVPLDFHARYDCTGKEYVYKVWNSPYKNPFLQDRYLHYKKDIDVELLNKTAKAFEGEHDFYGFCAAKTSVVDDFVRNVEYFTVERNHEEVIFKVKADGFLYNMVRIMVGTLLEVNEGKINPSDLADIINSLDRNKAGRTAPAHGLYLNKVFYKE